MQIRYYLAASAAALSIATAVSTPAMAQQITSGIEGTVVDDAGAPVVGATIEVTDTRTGNTRTISTGSTGSFSATGLTTGGPYTVTVNADGFEGQSIENLETSLQGNTSLGFALSTGGGEIVVTGTRVRVTQLAVGPGTSFSAEVLENAPTFNRDVRDIIRIDPRVSLDRDDGGSGVDRISCLGGNDRGNAFTVDGISQGDVYGLNDTGFSSRPSTPIPYDAIRETQVQFAPFDVEYGNFTTKEVRARQDGTFQKGTSAELRQEGYQQQREVREAQQSPDVGKQRAEWAELKRTRDKDKMRERVAGKEAAPEKQR